MAWESLQNSLGGKPQVLAGPILRRVTPESVTVWVATRTAATVELSVTVAGGITAAAAGTGRTVAVGKHLHIVAVTARPGSPSSPLMEGVVYTYDLKFGFNHTPPSVSLSEATGHAQLASTPTGLPSFALPPRT